jgi:hypothetical protein
MPQLVTALHRHAHPKTAEDTDTGVPPAFRTADQIRSVSERMKGIGEETPEIHARVS